MQVRSHRQRKVTIELESAGEISSNVQKEEETQIIKNFIEPHIGYEFLPIQNYELDKIKKKLIAFSIQYGHKNQKTTSIFLNYLENSREAGFVYLKNKDLLKAASMFSDCLAFKDPDYDEVYLEKFTNIKIDVINKLMFCIFELESLERNDFHYDPRRLDLSLKLMQHFLDKIKDYQFYPHLLKSESCLLEVTFFYFARLFQKKSKPKKAEEEFKTALEIIKEKNADKVYEKNQNLQIFSQNLTIKIAYKLSKCYRGDKTEKGKSKQAQYERIALAKAKQSNRPLFAYINRKIRFYHQKKIFQAKLSKLEGRKRIEEEVAKVIEEAKQTEFESLYDVYLDEVEH